MLGVKPEVQQKLLNVDLLGGQLTELGTTEQTREHLHRSLAIEHARRRKELHHRIVVLNHGQLTKCFWESLYQLDNKYGLRIWL